jgi:hypothetical protein
MRNWKPAYVAVADFFLALGLTEVTAENFQTKLEAMHSDFRAGSQGPSDFAAIRGTDGKPARKLNAQGVVSDWRKGYPTLYFVDGNKYTLIPAKDRLTASGKESATPKTKAELLAALATLEATAPNAPKPAAPKTATK